MTRPVAEVSGNGAGGHGGSARHRVLAIIYRAEHIFIQFFFGNRYNVTDHAVSTIGIGAHHQQVSQ